jgi:hypothetical protein
VGHVAAAANVNLPDAVAILFLHAFDDTFALLVIVGLIVGALGLVLRRQPAAQHAAALPEGDGAAPECRLLAS